MKNTVLLKELILKNLSFYSWMTIPQILFEISEIELQNFPNVDKEKFFSVLKELEKEGYLKSELQGGEVAWIRILKKRKKSFRFWVRYGLDYFKKFF